MPGSRHATHATPHTEWPATEHVCHAAAGCQAIILTSLRHVGAPPQRRTIPIFNLNDFPAVRQAVKDQDVALEVCPISNQVLRHVDDLREQPGARFLRDGLPVTLSSDGPGIWGAVGVTYDFWTATVAVGFEDPEVPRHVFPVSQRHVRE